jgi:hypothetical protein
MTLQYQTFDELMASIEGGLETYVENNMVDYTDLIREARYVNADLGLKLNKKKEVTIQIENYKGELPLDFMSAVIMTASHIKDVYKTKVDNFNVIEYEGREIPKNSYLEWDNNTVYIVKPEKNKFLSTRHFEILKPSKTSIKRFCDSSPNISSISEYTIDFKEEEIHTNFKEGELHLVYLADLVNEEGELLVLDHELTNKYYEYAIKTKIFEKLYFDYNEDVERKYKELRDVLLAKAKGEARNIVATPEYKAMRAYTKNMIANFYTEYYRAFI